MSLALPSPVLVAAGCGGTGRELDALGGLAGLGGFVTRTLTLDPREGEPGPRVRESASGFLHSTGLANPGLEAFLALELPWLAAHDVPVLVSVAAASLGEYADLGRRLGRAPGVAGLEVNLGSPDPRAVGLFDAREPFQAARVMSAVGRDLPAGTALVAKLAADPGRVVEAARAVADAGAHAVVVPGGLPARDPDGRPAALGGPAIAPVVRWCVGELRAALPELDVVASGGVCDTAGARAMLAAGAVAVQVGSALLHDPTTAARIAADLREEA